jgi:pyrroline-5-carboxylate reductase
MKIAILGAGSMGEALASLLLAQSVIESDELLLVTRTTERHSRLGSLYPGVTISTVPDDRFIPDVVILSVKPQDYQLAQLGLGHWFEINPLVVSLMSGIQIKKISSHKSFPSQPKVIRAMPNLPFMFGEGATGYFCSEFITEQDEALFKLLFEPTGFILPVKKEEDLDIVTALSASGPGFIAPLYRALYQSAAEAGLAEDEAELLLRQTLRGFIALLDQGLSAKEIEKLVSSKGGTTEAAKNVFKKHKSTDIIAEAIISAIERATQLASSVKE